MNKILKSLGVLTFGFYFANLFSMQAQSQVELDKVAQQKLMETKLGQVLNLLKEVKDIENQPNSLVSKTYDFFSTILRESLLVGGSGVIALGTTALLSYNGTIDKFAGTQAPLGLGNGLVQEAFKQQNPDMIFNDKEHGSIICLTTALSVVALWGGTYLLSKLLLVLIKKLSTDKSFDKETKEKLDKIEKLLEQVKFTQELKTSVAA